MMDSSDRSGWISVLLWRTTRRFRILTDRPQSTLNFDCAHETLPELVIRVGI